MSKWLCNAVELADYRVVKDIPQTILKAGDEFPAFHYTVLGSQFIMIGMQALSHEAFDFLLSVGSIERKF